MLTRYQAARIYRGQYRELSIADYFVVDKLGRGGIGIVLKARHHESGEVYALKRLLRRTSDEHTRRFLREVDVATQLDHPNIVRAHHAGQADGHPYLVMEFVDGCDLHRYVDRRGPLSIDEGLSYVIQAARGLEYAHGQGVIHRDVKPSNLLLNSNGVIKIADMGLARFMDHAAGSTGLGSQQAEQVTETDAVLGSISFMAPEQALDYQRTDHRADIFSLGCAMYYLLSGNSSLPGATRGERLKALFDPRTPQCSLSESVENVPPPLEAIYQCMVAKDVERRYQSLGDVIMDLTACAETVPSG
jgi:serine/threonine-protein kinase